MSLRAVQSSLWSAKHLGHGLAAAAKPFAQGRRAPAPLLEGGWRQGVAGGRAPPASRNFHSKKWATMEEAQKVMDRLKGIFTGDISLDVPKEKEWVSFSEDEELSVKWLTGSDSDWGGTSMCKIELVDGEEGRKAISFSGTLSLTIPQAQEHRGMLYGKVSKQPVKSGMVAFGSRRNVLDDDLEHFNALRIRVKGDGRMYLINVRTEALREGDLYQTVIKPAPGVWQTLTLPFTNFMLTNSGMVNVSDTAMNTRQMQFFGVTLMDNKDGPFEFFLESAKAVRDDSVPPLPSDA